MEDLITRVMAEKWHMGLFCYPDDPVPFTCILAGQKRVYKTGQTPESVLIDAIQEMDA